MRSPRRSAWQPDALEPAYFRHSALGKAVSSNTRRNTVLVSDREYLLRRGEDLLRSQLSSLEAEAFELIGNLYQPAGVHDVVGGVQDAALEELLLDSRVGQLVV